MSVELIQEIFTRAKELNAQIGDVVRLDKRSVVQTRTGWQPLNTPYAEYVKLNAHTHPFLKNSVCEILQRASNALR